MKVLGKLGSQTSSTYPASSRTKLNQTAAVNDNPYSNAVSARTNNSKP
jgi:hypothetical protein